MNMSEDEYQRGFNRLLEEVPYPPLNLRLTTTPEFINLFQSGVRQDYTCPHQQIIALTPPETPKNPEKIKAMNFPISKIIIGQWTRVAIYPEDLKAKFYFAKKKLIWEFLEKVETETQVTMLKRKIEIQWSDVLSFRRNFYSHDESGTLEIELGKRPMFYMETNPQVGKHTQWKHMDQDFTIDQSASLFRRHTLHFAPRVLQNNLEKLVSNDTFWSKLAKVTFPVLQDPYFFIEYGNNNNYNTSSGHGHCQTLCFNNNDELLNYNSQGFGHIPVGEVNFSMTNQFCANDVGLLNSFVQDNLQNYTANGPYLQGLLAQEEQIQNTEHTKLDGNFQINSFSYYEQYVSNYYNGSLPPDL